MWNNFQYLKVSHNFLTLTFKIYLKLTQLINGAFVTKIDLNIIMYFLGAKEIISFTFEAFGVCLMDG